MDARLVLHVGPNGQILEQLTDASGYLDLPFRSEISIEVGQIVISDVGCCRFTVRDVPDRLADAPRPEIPARQLECRKTAKALPQHFVVPQTFSQPFATSLDRSNSSLAVHAVDLGPSNASAHQRPPADTRSW